MKMKISLFLLVTIAFVMTIGCERHEYCQCEKKLPPSTSSGIIIENAKLKINDPKTGEYFTELVINEESLQGENSYKVSFDDGVTFDNIDFSKYTILGYPIIGEGRTSYNRNVTKDVTNKKYIYTVDALECVYYKVASEATNCVLIPKIEDGYTVEFVVNYARWKNGKTTQISKEEW